MAVERSGARALDGTLLGAVVDSAAEAIVIATVDGVITSWNPAAERLYGYSAEQARGRSIAILKPLGEEGSVERLEAAASGVTSRVEAEQLRRDGARVKVEVTVAPIRDRAGTAIRVWCATREAAERRLAARELARLAEAGEYGTDAIVSIDLEGYVRTGTAGRSNCTASAPGMRSGTGRQRRRV